jgi:hypothetical protein
VPVFLALERKPEDGKTLEHFFLVLVETVPFPYGAEVERTGITVAVLRIVVTSAADETAWLLPRAELIAPDEPDPVPAAVAAAVSVTVTVERATVTVTGTQPVALEAPEAAPRAADPEAEEAGTTVT